MFPRRWNQLPWRNIDVKGAYHVGEGPRMQAALSLIRTAVPAGARPRNSAGINPSWQTDCDSAGSVPSP